MKRPFIAPALALILFLASLSLMAVSYMPSIRFTATVGATGPHGGLSLSPAFGWEITFADGNLGILLRSSNLYWEIEFWRLAAACALFIFLRSGIPSRWHLELGAKPTGVCRACGYDLRASKERCPECGTVISATSSSFTSTVPGRSE
jgi:hypothetical protein